MSAKRCVTALKVLYQKIPGGVGTDVHQDSEYSPGSGTADHHGDALVADPSHGLVPQHPTADGPPSADFNQDLGPDWMPDFDFSDPYDMSWFQIAAPGL